MTLFRGQQCDSRRHQSASNALRRTHRVAAIFSRSLQSVAHPAKRKLDQLHTATVLSDLGVIPGNRLESLARSRIGQHTIRINGQWRIFSAGWNLTPSM